MKILIAEDDKQEGRLYRVALEARGHKVTITLDGNSCIKAYKQALEAGSGANVFDVVILDYAMPEKNGLDAAKEILRLNDKQKLIFASAYVRETLRESVKHLEQVVYMIQKPFEPKVLVSLVEDMSTINELAEINKLIEKMNHGAPTDKQVNELLNILKRIQKIGL